MQGSYSTRGFSEVANKVITPSRVDSASEVRGRWGGSAGVVAQMLVQLGAQLVDL